MDLHTALEILGLNPGADAKAIKRAYHKRLKITKPDRDPEGFKQLRKAYEVASSGAADHEAPHPQGSSPRPVTERTLNAVAVHHALDEGRFADAHVIVMDPRWAEALLDDPDGSYAEATRRTGIATILDRRPAYEAVAAAYPDVFRPGDPDLQLLLGISRQWEHLQRVSFVPPEVHAFVGKALTVDLSTRLSLARGLARWYWRDRPSATKAFIVLLEEYPAVASFLYQRVRDFDTHVHPDGPLPLEAMPTPAARIRFVTIWAPLVVAIAAMLIIAVSPGPLMPRASVAILLAIGSVAMLGHPADSDEFHIHYLDSCLAHDEPPQNAADRVRVSKRLRQALGANMVMEFGFRIGRLARLGPDTAPAEVAVR